MSDSITQSVRFSLPLGIVFLLGTAASAQPILWGTAAANGANPSGRLLRIDYATGTVQAVFNGPPGVVIGDGFSGVAIRPSNGQVYVVDGLGTNNVYRFDPDTGAVLGSFPSPTGSSTLDALEFFSDELYAQRLSSSIIVRINPDTGALIGTLPNSLSGSNQGGLTIADGAIFSRGSSNTTIARRDFTTGMVVGQFPTPNNEVVLGLASDGTDLYAASNAGFLHRIDVDTGNVLDSRNIGIILDGLAGPAPVPEPSALLLVLAPGLVCYARRRSRSARSRGETMGV